MLLSITLSPPPEGSIIEVPLGQERIFVVSGGFNGTDDSGVSVTVAAGGRVFTATVDASNLSYQASIALRSPSEVSVVATLHSRQWVETQDHGRWVYQTSRSNTIKITVQDTLVNSEFLIVCRCVDAGRHPLVGLDIDAFDRDPHSPDDKLGATAVTDADGRAEFHFHRSDFTDHPGERYPDVVFRIRDRGAPLDYELPGERNDHGMLRNFIPRPEPVIVHVLGMQGYVVEGAIREKWLSLGAHTGFLGRPTTDEQPTSNSRGRFNHFEGGSIYWTPDWGAVEVHGLIRAKWATLSWEQGFLGFPVTDELPLPGTDGGRYSLFEHGIVTWWPGQAEAVAEQHHYERIYAQVRAHILSRFFAIGAKGRRNHLSLSNRLQGPVPLNPATDEERREAERARWRIKLNDNENPWLFGSWVLIAMAVEHAAGNAESGRVLESFLSTLDSLLTWAEPGDEATARLPQRWDAGMPTGVIDEAEQFLDGGNSAYGGALPARDMHHYPRRANATLAKLIGPTAAGLYASQHGDYWLRYRCWELSMDELTGLVTLCWAVGKLAASPAIQSKIVQQTTLIGNYLADNGYVLVRPMGAVSWRGAMGLLPALEHPFSRALGATTMVDFRARTDFRGAMERAGYWQMLEGPITYWQALGWSLAVLLPLVAPPIASALALGIATTEAIVAGQVLSPGTLAGAYAVYLHRDCFDVNGTEGGSDEQPEAAAALLCRDAPNKSDLYRIVATGQARFASFRTWSVNFHSWIGLTGLDDQDSTVRDTFAEWFMLRQSQPYSNEPKGQGSRSLFASGVAALLLNDGASEERLVAGLERALVELFRTCYFDPQLPVKIIDGNAHECCAFGHGDYEADSSTPYGPLDFMVAMALAFWHARRRADASNPVTTARFPQPLVAIRFPKWPKIAVPIHCLAALQDVGIPVEAIQGTANPIAGSDGYPLFEAPLVPRRTAPEPEHLDPATVLMCDVTVPVRAVDTGDVATGVTLFKGHELQIDATGDIWAGVPLDPRNGPQGHPRLINDARWPLHTGIDPAANAFCLLGRLNGYFRIGEGMPRTRWRYHAERPLFLRVNDEGPGDGNGQFDVRIRVWGPAGFDPARVYLPPNIVRSGGVLHTSEAADVIEVEVMPGAVDGNEVEFVLATPDRITWRKEIIIKDAPGTGTGQWTIWTQDGKHRDANGLYRYQLPGATLEFRKMKFGGGMWTMVVLANLDAAPPGVRITFNWERD
jgi:hypothetical protein